MRLRFITRYSDERAFFIVLFLLLFLLPARSDTYLMSQTRRDSHVPLTKGITVADLPPKERAVALRALDAAEDAEGLTGPGGVEIFFRNTGRVLKNVILGVGRIVLIIITADQIHIPKPGEDPDSIHSPSSGGKPGDPTNRTGQFREREMKAYERSGDMLLGYVSDERSGQISPADQILPNLSLSKSKVLFRINRFYVFDYPGKPPHSLALYLMPIKAREITQESDQARKDGAEQPLYAFRAEGEPSAISNLETGYLFTVNSVPQEGVGFTVRVSKTTEGFFRRILKKFIGMAAWAAHEATKLPDGLVGRWHAKEADQIAEDIKKWMEKKHTKPIIDTNVFMALTGPGNLKRLREGIYVMVQASPDGFSWGSAKYDSGKVVQATTQKELEYNYMIVGVEAIQQSTRTTLGNASIISTDRH